MDVDFILYFTMRKLFFVYKEMMIGINNDKLNTAVK